MSEVETSQASIKFEIIKEGNRFYAIPTVFLNEDGFPQNSRCNECNKFNRRLTAPNDVKVTTGKDGRTYITPKVDNCWQHEPVGKGSKPTDVEWEVYRGDYYVRVQHTFKKKVITTEVEKVKYGSVRWTYEDIVEVTKDYWPRADLVEYFIANPPFAVEGDLSVVSV